MDLLVDSFPDLLTGLVVTLLLGVVSFILGSVLGAAIVLAKISGNRVLPPWRPRTSRSSAARRCSSRS
jgi:cystine transport system permease protein